jgi:hypothetical protein
MTFATHGPGTLAQTVRPPIPRIGHVTGTAMVELDGVCLPQAVSSHHAAATFIPPKQTFEGDNMLVVPQYKCDLQAKSPLSGCLQELAGCTA